MKLYGAFDFWIRDLHSNNCVVVILDDTGQTVFKKCLNNTIEIILEALSPFQAQLDGLVVESTFNWYWLVDDLMDAGFTVHLANTAAIQQYSGLKHADDITHRLYLSESTAYGARLNA